MSTFGHVMTAMVTPFDKEGGVAYARCAELAKRLLSEGSDSLLVCGTTGESPTLTHGEKLKLFRTVKEAAGSARVIAGTGTNDTRASVALTREAENLGVDGILVVSPYYNKPPQEGLYRHFRAVAEATRLPVVIYNIPGRTGVNLEVTTLKRLAELPNVVGVKEASGNLDQVSETARIVGAAHGAMSMTFALSTAASTRMQHAGSDRPGTSAHGASQTTENRFCIYSGDDSLTLPMLSVGAVGVISVASHVAGPEIKQMVTAFLNGDVALAANLHTRLFPLFKGLFTATNPILVKAALRLKGFDAGGLRLPLVEATESQIDGLRAVMQEVGVLS